jgi:hypothetical protein
MIEFIGLDRIVCLNFSGELGRGIGGIGDGEIIF